MCRTLSLSLSLKLAMFLTFVLCHFCSLWKIHINLKFSLHNLCLYKWVSTFNRVEEVEERVVGHLLGNSAHSSTAFMLLFLLNSFHCYVFALVPVYLTAVWNMLRQYNISKWYFYHQTATILHQLPHQDQNSWANWVQTLTLHSRWSLAPQMKTVQTHQALISSCTL